MQNIPNNIIGHNFQTHFNYKKKQVTKIHKHYNALRVNLSNLISI